MAQLGVHPNIVSLVGFVSTGLPPILIVSYCEHGSLLHVLNKTAEQRKPLSLKHKLGMAVQVCGGMAYLTSKSFVHRDLAARNVLVASGMQCKVADFGLSRATKKRTGKEYQYYKGANAIIPVKWTAPEAMLTARFSPASDVWSFGILVVELLGDGASPYPGMSVHEVIRKVANEDEGYRHPAPSGCPGTLYALLLQCWNVDKTARPGFEAVRKQLQQLANQTTASADEPLQPQQPVAVAANSTSAGHKVGDYSNTFEALPSQMQQGDAEAMVSSSTPAGAQGDYAYSFQNGTTPSTANSGLAESNDGYVVRLGTNKTDGVAPIVYKAAESLQASVSGASSLPGSPTWPYPVALLQGSPEPPLYVPRVGSNSVPLLDDASASSMSSEILWPFAEPNEETDFGVPSPAASHQPSLATVEQRTVRNAPISAPVPALNVASFQTTYVSSDVLLS